MTVNLSIIEACYSYITLSDKQGSYPTTCRLLFVKCSFKKQITCCYYWAIIDSSASDYNGKNQEFLPFHTASELNQKMFRKCKTCQTPWIPLPLHNIVTAYSCEVFTTAVQRTLVKRPIISSPMQKKEKKTFRIQLKIYFNMLV